MGKHSQPEREDALEVIGALEGLEDEETAEDDD